MPIALVALPLIYTTDFSLYSLSAKPKKSSSLTRIFYSVALGILLLFVAWYAFIIISIAIETF